MILETGSNAFVPNLGFSNSCEIYAAQIFYFCENNPQSELTQASAVRYYELFLA